MVEMSATGEDGPVVEEWEVRFGVLDGPRAWGGGREPPETYAVARISAATRAEAEAMVREPVLPEGTYGEVVWSEIHAIVRRPGDAKARLRALRAVGALERRLEGIADGAEIGSGLTAADLVPYLSDEDAGMRCSAARALGAVDPFAAREHLLRMSETEPNRFVRAIAEGALRSVEIVLRERGRVAAPDAQEENVEAPSGI